jgi:hypothetical protein
MEPINDNNQKMLLSYKTFRIIEKISSILLVIPYAIMMSYILFYVFARVDYFILFPISLFSFFPIGIFAFLIQILRKIQKGPPDPLNGLFLVCSLITVIIGVFAWMLIYVVTG